MTKRNTFASLLLCLIAAACNRVEFEPDDLVSVVDAGPRDLGTDTTTTDPAADSGRPQLDASLPPGDGPTLLRNEKGWELYSWVTSGLWYYSVTAGTNRCKTIQEIQTGALAGNYQVQGVDMLDLVLSTLAPGEQILWSTGMCESFSALSFPDAATIERVRAMCESHGLILSVITPAPSPVGLHADCSAAVCATGQTCVDWYTVAGELRQTCEITCTTDPDCPAGTTCEIIIDGPGQVCYGL